MIFVSVGTDTHDFSRLLRRMDEVARTKEVVMQIGHSHYRPRHARWFAFETNAAIDRLYSRADVIVTHAGAGSIISALVYGKVPLVVPRLQRFGEHVNDHQLDVARFLDRKGMVKLVADLDRLPTMTARKYRPDRRLARRLDAYLEGRT
ncbi:MAG: beta-1,4-galactosyltransferase [Candidatus Aenigmarchaeota archaeon]|nr:beta-1,4-galactosyltransferase [Candidatus Aenigmarchaeota archaeon]